MFLKVNFFSFFYLLETSNLLSAFIVCVLKFYNRFIQYIVFCMWLHSFASRFWDWFNLLHIPGVGLFLFLGSIPFTYKPPFFKSVHQNMGYMYCFQWFTITSKIAICDHWTISLCITVWHAFISPVYLQRSVISHCVENVYATA